MILEGGAEFARGHRLGLAAGTLGYGNLMRAAEGHAELVAGNLEEIAAGDGVFGAAGRAAEEFGRLDVFA